MTDKPSGWALREAEELIGGDGDRYFISQEEIEAVAAALDAAYARAIEDVAQMLARSRLSNGQITAAGLRALAEEIEAGRVKDDAWPR